MPEIPINLNVKIRLKIFFALLAVCQGGQAQGFVNLNFEQAVITNISGFDYAQVRGWTGYYGWMIQNYSDGVAITYNNETLDSANVSLEGTNYWRPAIGGKYSILLKGGSYAAGLVYPWMTNGASIGQTGQIPFGTKTIMFRGASNNGIVLSFGGNALSVVNLGDYPNYSIWGADISAYAGQTGELLFNAPWQTGYGMLDNIQFSSSPVPEPSTLALGALGTLLLSFYRWKKHP